jgi:hypothetical protein
VGRVGTRHDKRPRRVTSSATEMDCVNELYQLVEAMAEPGRRSARRSGELQQLVRGVHEVARKLEMRLVKEAAATSANGELKEQHSTVLEVPNPSISRRGATFLRRRTIAPPECRTEIPVTTRSGTFCTHPENTGPIPTMMTMITGSSRNGASDTDGRNDGLT